MGVGGSVMRVVVACEADVFNLNMCKPMLYGCCLLVCMCCYLFV